MKPIATTRSATGTPTGRLAVWWLIASEIVIFGGILGSYIMHRLGHPEFGDYASHTNTWIGAFNTLVLLTSSLTAVLAHASAEKGDGEKAFRFLMMTIGGAATFVVVKSIDERDSFIAGVPARVVKPNTDFDMRAAMKLRRRPFWDGARVILPDHDGN